MKTCLIDGCNKKHYGLGFCKNHNRKFRIYNDPLHIEINREHDEICKVDNCNNAYYSLGYCQKHYNKLKKYGDPLHSEIQREQEYHNMTKTTEYKTWSGMKARCYNHKTDRYPRYGGRGIIVCRHWKESFLAFLQDMGPKPFPEAQIDRIDNDGNYEPGNCRWATPKENSNNRSNSKIYKI